MPLKVTYQGSETVIEDDSTALIGSDAVATIRIVRPGISRRHAVVSRGDSGWTVEDTGSRNGSFRFGQRFESIGVDQSETIYLGHPTDGERLTLTPLDANSDVPPDDAPLIETFMLADSPPTEASERPESARDVTAHSVPQDAPADAMPQAAPEPPQVKSTFSRAQRTPREVDLAELTLALRDQINAVRGLTWSVWAMIAVTAALVVMTLFVGILGS